ncbi:MAG: SH3 domain-containing protein [Chloroflexota bacterium]|nr:SH3 domain-containing protein [Chloroflexota bacterium]
MIRHSLRWIPAVAIVLLAACSPPPDAPATSSPTTAPVESVSAPPTDSTPEITPSDATTTAPQIDTTPEVVPADGTVEAPQTETTPEGASDDSDPVLRVVQDNSGLRGGPGTNYPRVAVARSGDLLPVTGRSGEERDLWYQVTLPDGAIAWAWSRIAELQPASADVPEVEPPAAP